MTSAEHFLFEELYDGKPLFKSQLELVQRLLQTPNSAFFIEDASGDSYKRELNRLKTYMSQLLSSTVSRSISLAFKKSLELIIANRLAGTRHNPTEISEIIIQALAEKNITQTSKVYFTPVFRNSLQDDITSANYILIITARLFDAHIHRQQFSLQQLLGNEFKNMITQPSKKLKRFRFNFPLEQFCELFWIAMKKQLDRWLAEALELRPLLDSLRSKDLIQDATYYSLVKEGSSVEDISKASDEIIRYLAINQYICVFWQTEPVYSVPMIVTDPNDSKNVKAYTIIETPERTVINKLGIEDTLTWKFFVWDKLRTKQLGKLIQYKLYHSQ